MEIPLKAKYRTGKKSRQKSSTNNGGQSKQKNVTKQQIAESQEATRRNQKVMFLDFETTGNGKIRWLLKSEFDKRYA